MGVLPLSFSLEFSQRSVGIDRSLRMRMARFRKIILVMVGLITLAVAMVVLSLNWPSISFGFSLRRLDGNSSQDGEWNYSQNTYSDGISNSEVKEFHLRGSEHFVDLSPSAKAYRFADSMGYAGCATVVQYENHYVYVRVFGANDNDSISVGRASGAFPPNWCSNLKEVPTQQLPDGIIRPW